MSSPETISSEESTSTKALAAPQRRGRGRFLLYGAAAVATAAYVALNPLAAHGAEVATPEQKASSVNVVHDVYKGKDRIQLFPGAHFTKTYRDVAFTLKDLATGQRVRLFDSPQSDELEGIVSLSGRVTDSRLNDPDYFVEIEEGHAYVLEAWDTQLDREITETDKEVMWKEFVVPFRQPVETRTAASYEEYLQLGGEAYGHKFGSEEIVKVEKKVADGELSFFAQSWDSRD